MERLSGRIILLWGWRRGLAAFLAGALAVLSAPPYDFFAVCFVSFPVLVWLLDGTTIERPAHPLKRLAPAFFTGWWFGFGYFACGLWWVGSAMLVDADEFAWAIPVAVLMLPAILALFYGLAAALARLLWTDDIGRIAALAAAFAFAEWLREFVFTGFPWNPVGYAAMPVPVLMQSVWVTGTIGMNALAVFVFSMPALLAGRRHRRTGFAVALLLVAAHAGFGYARLAASRDDGARKIAVRIVQPAIDQAQKVDDRVRDDIFRTLLQLSQRPPDKGSPAPQLVLWPETSVPFLFTQRPDALAAIGELLSDGQVLMAGAVREEGGAGASSAARYYNSIVAIDGAGEIVDAVDKVHLVPGGEYLPLQWLFGRLGIEHVVAIPMSFSPGPGRHAIVTPGGLRAAPFICYEIIFPELVDRGVADADFIVNVTNDAWFGDTPGPYQHFRQAQIRAVETGRPVIRAANTGISGVIDPFGRIVDALAIDARGVLDLSVSVPQAYASPIGDPRTNGLAIMAVFALIACGLAVSQRLRIN